MADHFNELEPSQLERLAILSEEMGEAQQIIGKILRHGLNSYDPTAKRPILNRELLAVELGDVLAAIDLLVQRGDIIEAVVEQSRRLRPEKIKSGLSAIRPAQGDRGGRAGPCAPSAPAKGAR